MGKLIYRLFAGLMVVAGMVLFAAMMQVSYGATQEWDQALIRLGMPLSFLLPMVGAMMVVIGWAMLSQSLAEGRDRRIGRHVRPSPGRWRGVSREPK